MSDEKAPILIAMEKPLHLTARGGWLYGGDPFTNAKVADLFTRSIVYDASSHDWWVAIGAQRARFTFDDSPIFVVQMSESGMASFSASCFAPIHQTSFSICSNEESVWYLSSSLLPCRARFSGSLQQQLSSLVEEVESKIMIVLSQCSIGIHNDER